MSDGLDSEQRVGMNSDEGVVIEAERDSGSDEMTTHVFHPVRSSAELLPVELVRTIFKEVVGGPELSDSYPTDLHHSRTPSGLPLSHICRHWRRTAVAQPDLWWISPDLDPEALATYVARSLHDGLRVHMAETDDPYDQATEARAESFNDFMAILEDNFDKIKVMSVWLPSEGLLHRFLELGRRARMERLQVLELEFRRNRNNRTHQPSESLDWDMPNIRTLLLSGVMHTPSVTGGRSSTPQVSLAFAEDSLRMGYSRILAQFAHVRCLHFRWVDEVGRRSPTDSISFSGAVPASDTIFTLPHLKSLQIQLINTVEDTSQMRHITNFDHFRFPSLETLTLSFAFRLYNLTSRQLLQTMANVRKLLIHFSEVSLNLLLDERMFPCLEDVDCTSCEVMFESEPSRSLRRIPTTLKIIRVEMNWRRQNWRMVPDLLEELHNRFQGRPNDFGILVVSCSGLRNLPNEQSASAYLREIHGRVGKEALSRLQLDIKNHVSPSFP